MALHDVLGALWTLSTLAALGAGGVFCAVALLGAAALADPLRLAVTALVCASAAGVLLALGLGVVGALLLPVALPLLVLAALVAAVLARRRLRLAADRPGVGSAFAVLRQASWRQIGAFPVLSLLTLHAAGTEALRGLLRPPLSWDSLMYHLLLTGSWLESGRVAPVFGPHPTNFYGYMPGNGSLWMWWWMAPSHSDLYVNLAFFPQCALLALATGAVARELGATRSWPIAGFLVLLMPTVIRFAATEYVDIFLGAAVVAATYFALRWRREAQASDAVLAGLALGLAAGTKLLGLPYAAGLAAVVVLLTRGGWRRRSLQVGAAALALLLCGSFFYVRNTVAGAGPLAARCESRPGPEPGALPTLPRPNTVLALMGPLLESAAFPHTFFGMSAAAAQELGVGPQALALLPVVFLLPFLLPRGRRLAGTVVWSQILLQLVIWVTVPYANAGQIFANVRYLIGALGLAFAGGIAVLEPRVSERWLRLIALTLAIQDLLTLHSQMPDGVRWTVAVLDCLAVAWALSPELQAAVRRRSRLIVAVAICVALALVPTWTQYRHADRYRALAEEFTTHHTSADRFAKAWSWLERHGGDGAVANVSSPLNFFVYPVMGERFARPAIYVNVNRADHPAAAEYPRCDPRTDFDKEAWLANLSRHEARWLMVSRFQPLAWPIENIWARARPDRFVLRYADPNAEIFAVLPAALPPS